MKNKEEETMKMLVGLIGDEGSTNKLIQELSSLTSNEDCRPRNHKRYCEVYRELEEKRGVKMTAEQQENFYYAYCLLNGKVYGK